MDKLLLVLIVLLNPSNLLSFKLLHNYMNLFISAFETRSSFLPQSSTTYSRALLSSLVLPTQSFSNHIHSDQLTIWQSGRAVFRLMNQKKKKRKVNLDGEVIGPHDGQDETSEGLEGKIREVVSGRKTEIGRNKKLHFRLLVF